MSDPLPLRCYGSPVPAHQERATTTEGFGAVLDIEALAQRLRDRRTASGLSVRQAAEQVGVSFMTLSRVESGSQPDLATFMKLCAWLGTPAEEFFLRGPQRPTDTVEAVTRHLVTDRALDRDAAQRIAAVVRDMYAALARQASPEPVVACHLRARTLLRPGVPPRLGSLLSDMQARLEELSASGEL